MRPLAKTSVCVVVVLISVTALIAADNKKLSEELEKGRQAYIDHNYAEAERHFRQAVQADPQSLPANMYLGHSLFYQQKFKEAVGPYGKARELNASTKQLDQTNERVLTDQLGMAYGISGNLKKAESVFKDAITKDQDFALYHYNLACTYAEMGDLDKTITTLSDAYDRRENLLPGETFPDPRKDDSFQRYLNNPKFQELLKHMGYE
jgi:tetratricopeptide (TPR) repeat protein